MDYCFRGHEQPVERHATKSSKRSSITCDFVLALYPDMVVYGGSCVEVKQKDPLFERAALLTLGLQSIQEGSQSVYWSLPLACLQYYGDPVQASRSMGQENSRIIYQQFAFVVLGCLFKAWNSLAPNNDDGLQWVERLSTVVGLTSSTCGHAREAWWLVHLSVAAQEFLDYEISEQRTAHQLMNLGRRFPGFLGLQAVGEPPLFGLAEIKLFVSVLRNDQQRVQCLRRYIYHHKLDLSRFLVKYRPSAKKSKVVWASVEPLRRISTKRAQDGTVKESDNLPESYVQWLSLSTYQLKLCDARSDELEDLPGTIKRLQELKSFAYSDVGIRASEIQQETEELKEIIEIGQLRREIEETGELCLPVLERRNDPQPHHHESDDFQTSDYDTGQIFSDKLDFLGAVRDIITTLDRPVVRVSPTFFTGDDDSAAIFSINHFYTKSLEKPVPSSEYLKEVFNTSNIDPVKVLQYYSRSHERIQSLISGLRACALIAEIYRRLPGATISALVVNQSVNRAKWVPNFPLSGPEQRANLTRSEAFACVARCESGTRDLDPRSLREVFAMSSGNSLYIAGDLLCDPCEHPQPSDIRRVVGNIGRAGITFLIPPPEVRVRKANPERWMAINHNTFDGKLENYFQQTSIHLSFTAYEAPLIGSNPRHTIDRDIVLVESLVSVYDGGTWVAELDILKAFGKPRMLRVDPNHIYGVNCNFLNKEERARGGRGGRKAFQDASKAGSCLAVVTSIENWDELIEAPSSGVIVVRAHKNWLARVATTTICVRMGFTPIILPEDPCWTCCAELVRISSTERFALIC